MVLLRGWARPTSPHKNQLPRGRDKIESKQSGREEALAESATSPAPSACTFVPGLLSSLWHIFADFCYTFRNHELFFLLVQFVKGGIHSKKAKSGEQQGSSSTQRNTTLLWENSFRKTTTLYLLAGASFGSIFTTTHMKRQTMSRRSHKSCCTLWGLIPVGTTPVLETYQQPWWNSAILDLYLLYGS